MLEHINANEIEQLDCGQNSSYLNLVVFSDWHTSNIVF